MVDEIRRTEEEQKLLSVPERKQHLRDVRLYGDALAHSLLSTYAIRQLSRNSGKPPHLGNLGEALDLVLDQARAAVAHGIPPLLADLTTVIRNADLILCHDCDLVTLVECKLNPPKHPRFARQGRRGRQLARLTSISDFLRTGRGVIFGENRERVTVKVDHTPQYMHQLVREMVEAALAGRPSVRVLADELYAVALSGESAGDVARAISQLDVRQGNHMAVGSSLDLLTGRTDFRPPILWDIGPAAQWALMEGDVTITHAARADALVGLRRGSTQVVALAVTPSASVPWTYELTVEGESITLTGTIVLDVVLTHETLESAGDNLLLIAEASKALRDASRPVSPIGVAEASPDAIAPRWKP